MGGEISVDLDLLAFEEKVFVEVNNGLRDFIDDLVRGGDFIGESRVHEECIGGLVFSLGAVEVVFSEAHCLFLIYLTNHYLVSCVINDEIKGNIF